MSIERLNQGTLALTSELPFHGDGADRRAPVSELIDLTLETIGASGDPPPLIVVAANYVLSADDDRATLIVQDPLIITVPEGLVLTYGVVVRAPASGTVTVRPGSGAVLLNEVSADLVRDQILNPNGFAITPKLTPDSWGVSLAVTAPVAPSYAALTGTPADNPALLAALALKADLAPLPVTLLRTVGPRAGVASGVAQIFFIGSGNPSQAIIPAGLLATTSQRVSVRFFVTKNGSTDPLAVNLYLGTAGTNADPQIGGTGVLPTGIRQGSGEFVVQRIDATHVSCHLRMEGISTTAFAGTTFVVPTLAADTVLSLAIKTAATDIPTLVSCEMELR